MSAGKNERRKHSAAAIIYERNFRINGCTVIGGNMLAIMCQLSKHTN